MHRPFVTRQRGPDGRFSSNDASATATTAHQSVSLFTLPPEIRLAIYEYSFTGVEDCTLRRFDDVTPPNRPRTHEVFNNAILQTCKTVHAEALPLFYASHTFHYPAERGGAAHGQPGIKEAHLGCVKRLSISVPASLDSTSHQTFDAVVARHIHLITQHCARLSSFTLHVLPSSSNACATPPAPEVRKKGPAAKALRKLHARLDQLSIVTFGWWDTLHPLREAVAVDGEWVEGGRCGEWPGLSLTGEQRAAVSVKRRRYTLVGYEDYVHPHQRCIRVFRTRGSRNGEEAREGGC